MEWRNYFEKDVHNNVLYYKLETHDGLSLKDKQDVTQSQEDLIYGCLLDTIGLKPPISIDLGDAETRM